MIDTGNKRIVVSEFIPYFCRTSLQVDPVHLVFKCYKKVVLAVKIKKCRQLCIQQTVGSFIGYIDQLFNGVELSVEMVYLDSHFTLMASAVHVSIYGKAGISALVNIEDLYPTRIIFRARIKIIIARE